MSEYVRHVQQLTKPLASRLEELCIELTERCNNDCVHCCINLPVGDKTARSREMTTTQVKEVLQQAADLGYMHVHLTGGEPLLRPDFEELYIFARRLGVKVVLFTNGRLITPRLADLFVRIPPLVEIEITVYGMHQESYEAVTRVPGSFAQFWRGVNLLWERHVPFVVKCALLPPNRAEMDEFEAGPPTLPWKTTRPPYSMNFDLRSRCDDAEKNRLIESLRLSPQEVIAVVMRDTARYRPWTRAQAARLLQAPGDRLFNCGACNGLTTCVDAYGRVQPCIGIRARELTVDLLDGTQGETETRLLDYAATRLQHALDSFTHLSELRANNPDYLRRCARCFLKAVCLQCPAKSWTEHGTFDTPVEYLCDVAHAWARYQGWLGENEHSWEITDWLERI
jgi:sulfatase maturation enzyme AslB (radical SAM superfamily)